MAAALPPHFKIINLILLPTENSEQLLSVFVSGSVVMKVILNTTFVLWLTAQLVYCTLMQPGCTIDNI